MNAKDTLGGLIDTALENLEGLNEDERRMGSISEYAHGIRAALVQVLETIQKDWDEAAEFGLDFDIETEFPPK